MMYICIWYLNGLLLTFAHKGFDKRGIMCLMILSWLCLFFHRCLSLWVEAQWYHSTLLWGTVYGIPALWWLNCRGLISARGCWPARPAYQHSYVIESEQKRHSMPMSGFVCIGLPCCSLYQWQDCRWAFSFSSCMHALCICVFIYI